MTHPTESPRRLPAILNHGVREEWLAIAQGPNLDSHWVPGRQGTGYEKLDLVAALGEGLFPKNSPFVEEQVAQARSMLGVDTSRGWDAYLLRYATGAFVPEHRDPTTALAHLRFNAIILQAAEGTGLLKLGGQAFDLAEGDAVLFRPDALPHQVSEVKGERIVLSIGCVFDPAQR